jgi:curved DNA-binding protein CbpA
MSRSGGDIFLPVDMQRELRELESRGAQLTHYELLGVGADADGGDIRRAYLTKSKRFHPDAWYGTELGTFGPVLAKWFQRMAGAYEVLSDQELRAAYDRDHLSRFSGADRAAVEKRELSRAEEERRARERRERLMHTKGFARIGAARKLYEEAQAHAGKGERSEAIAALKAARELDPNRKEIAARLLELEREQARARANSALTSAREREEQGRWHEALAAYGGAFQLDPHNLAAALGAGRCALEDGDARSASNWAARAADLAPDDPAPKLLLAKAFAGLNMKARARGELTDILNKNPQHKEAKALLKAL